MPARILARLALPLLVLATAAPIASANDAQTAYDAVLEHYKAKDWDALLDRAPAFLKAHSGFKHAPTVLYMHAVAQFERRRFPAAVETADAYLKAQPEGKYAERVELLRARALFKSRRTTEAAAAFDAFLAKRPTSRSAQDAREWRARIDPKDEKVEGLVVLDYAGKYVDDARLASRVREVVRLVPVGLQGLAGSMRLPAVPKPRVRVRFADMAERQGLPHMQTREELRGVEVWQSIVVHTEPLVLDLYDLSRTLTHELVHVIHRDRLGEAYYGVPDWVQEGLAVWAAGQGPERLPEIYVNELTRPGDVVSRLADGLSDPDHDFVDYGEDYLAFDWVEKNKGLPVAQALARGLLGSADWRGAFEKATGMPFPRFEETALEAARSRFRADLAEAPSYHAVRAIADAKEWARAAEGFERLRAQSPRHVALPLILRDLATAYLELGRFDEARAALDACERSQPHGGIRDDVAYRRVWLTSKAGKPDDARRLAEEVLRDYSWKDRPWRERVRKLGGLPEKAEAAPSSDDTSDD